MEKAETRRPTPRGRRPGFTMVELLFVLLIGGVLTTMAMPQFSRYASKRNAINGRTAISMAAARARAASVERGEVVVMMIRIYRDSVFVMSGAKTGGAAWSDTLEVIGFHNGDIQGDIILEGTPAPFIICYVPRGFAHPGCEHGNLLGVDIGVASPSGRDTVWAELNAVGRVKPK